jgi:alpha-tubulin suppressor-like RCC1 family protein
MTREHGWRRGWHQRGHRGWHQRGRRGLRSAVTALVLGLAASWLAAVPAAAPASAAATPLVTAGGGHSCALMPDATVWCWGRNTTGQLGDGNTTDSLVPVWVRALPPAADVSAGHDHTCAVDQSGSVWCWGANAFGELGGGTISVSDPFPVLAQGVAATQVSAGDGFTCAVTVAATVDCWGDNNYGELGDGSTADASTPQPVTGLTGVTQVAAGNFHACALKSDGTVWCWGSNTFGALGNGSKTQSLVPVEASIENAAYVAAGADDSCAISSGGGLRCWGANDVGQLGVGDFTDHPLPTQVVAMTSGVQQVTLGGDFGCAIASVSGPAAFCWGDAAGHGHLGNGSFSGEWPFPVQVFGLMTAASGLPTGPQQISAGSGHACVLLASGPAECWGQGAYGSLGDGATSDKAIPTPVAGLPTSAVYGLTAGTVTGCAVITDLQADCWGQMTGDGSPLLSVHTSAVPVTGLPAAGVSQVSAGFGACAVVLLGGLSTGARCWGDNSAGELGDNTTTDRTTPVKVHGLTGVQEVTVGGRHSCALVHNGGAWCWGANGNGQLGDGTTTARHVPVAVQGLPHRVAQIAAGGSHTCALLVDGSVWCWGAGGKGQLGNGSTSDSAAPVAVTGLPGAVQITAGGNLSGGDTSCALTSAGAVYCWGWNSAGQLGNGSTTDSDVPVAVSGLSGGVTSIADNGGNACATLVSGQVDCWGDNSVDELGDGSAGGMSTTPVTVAGFSSLGTALGASNGASACAVSLAGQAECWGWNTDGQLGDGSVSNSDVPVPVQGL